MSGTCNPVVEVGDRPLTRRQSYGLRQIENGWLVTDFSVEQYPESTYQAGTLAEAFNIILEKDTARRVEMLQRSKDLRASAGVWPTAAEKINKEEE